MPFGDPETANLVGAVMIYEEALRPTLKQVLDLQLPQSWNHPRVKELVNAVRSNAPENAAGVSDQLGQPEFRRMARSILSVFAFIDLLRTVATGDPSGLFLFGFSEDTFLDVEGYTQAWLESLTARSLAVASLVLGLNGQPADQGATVGYWMGATIGNTIRAGVEELLRAVSPLG